MPSTRYSTLGGIVLPVQFSYKLPVPPKRHVAVKTHGGLRVHSPVNPIVGGDRILEFRVEGADNIDYVILYNLYVLTGVGVIAFTGYWSDAYAVSFLHLEKVNVRYRLFDIVGQLRLT
jgi:hypothetical protein